MNRALALSLQSSYLVAKKKYTYSDIIGTIMVGPLNPRSAFESVSMSTISITFLITSIVSCMSRELAVA